MSDVVLAARGLEKSYVLGGRRIDVLRGVDLDVAPRETVCVVGASGAGKSTLLHLLGWLERPDRGEIFFAGRQTSGLGSAERAALRRRHVGFVFQFHHLIHELDALENVLLPRMMERSAAEWWRHRAEERERARSLLAELGLGERLGHRPAQLSGGERQRVAIARALVSRPDVLLCDEPTGNLDERTAAETADLLFEVASRKGCCMVLVTHDREIAARADRVLRLHDGRLGPVEAGAGV